MHLEERPWENSYYRVLIFDSDTTPIKILPFEPPKIVPLIYTTIQTMDSEGNLGNLSKTMPIVILIKTSIVEIIQIRANYNPEKIASFTYSFNDLRDVFSWSSEKMHGIEPSIVKYEIKKY